MVTAQWLLTSNVCVYVFRFKQCSWRTGLSQSRAAHLPHTRPDGGFTRCRVPHSSSHLQCVRFSFRVMHVWSMTFCSMQLLSNLLHLFKHLYSVLWKVLFHLFATCIKIIKKKREWHVLHSYPQSFRLQTSWSLQCVFILDTADGMFFLWANSHWISVAVPSALHTPSISTMSSNSLCHL